MTSNLREIIIERKKGNKNFQGKISVTRCVTVGIDYSNDCAVMNRQGYIWVREQRNDGAIFQVFNDCVKRLVGLYVLVSDEYGPPYRRRVVGVDWDVTPNTSDFPQNHVPTVYSHALSHEWQDTYPAADAISVYPRAIVPMRVNPSIEGGVKIDITRGIYSSSGIPISYAGEVGYELTSYVPATGYSLGVLVYLDLATGAVSHVLGTAVLNTLAVTYPDMLSYTIPLAYIKLTGDMTELLESNIILDLRPIISVDNGSFRSEIAILAAEIDLQLSKHIVEGV